MTVETNFFLRFYDQTPENIKKCIREIRKAYPGKFKVKKSAATISQNPFIPAGVNFVQMLLVFPTREQATAFHTNDATFKIYEKYACGQKILTHGAIQPLKVKPGDPAFNPTFI
jgi:hypothetical protein